jgi:hypothetical protein
MPGGYCSSSLDFLSSSVPVGKDVLDLNVTTEVLDPFKEGFEDTTGLDKPESREGGSGLSGKFVAMGDCNLEDGTETTTGEETAVPVGLLGLRIVFNGSLSLGDAMESSSGPSPPSFVPPTDAFIRLYRPLSPPCTSSMPLTSLMEDEDGGTAKSSNVVNVSDREAAAWI